MSRLGRDGAADPAGEGYSSVSTGSVPDIRRDATTAAAPTATAATPATAIPTVSEEPV